MALTAGRGTKRRMAEDAALCPALPLAASEGQKRHRGRGVLDSLEILPERVLICLKRKVRYIVPDADVELLEVHRMGSRWYGLDGPESDLDMYATVPVEVYSNIQLSRSLITALNLEHRCGAVNVSFVGPKIEMFESRVRPSRLK